MRIALVTLDWHNHGGIERCVTQLGLGLASKGQEVHVFASSFEGAAPKGIRFHEVKVWRRPWALKMLGFASASARALEGAGAFDIVHVHCAYQGPCDLASAHSVHRVALERDPAPPGLAWAKAWLRGLPFLLRPLSDKAYVRARLRLAISRRVKQELARAYGPTLATDVIYYGVDPKAFRPLSPARKKAVRRRMGLEEGRFWFCFSGWNWRRKGLDVLFQALLRLPENIGLLVVGEDPLEGRNFRAMAQGLGFGSRVRFAGRLKEPQEAMAACDAFAFPTRYEPFGMVVSEAMACGLPVLVTALAGASEVISQGREAQILEDPENSLDLAAKMRALSQGRLAARLGAANRRAALGLSWEKHVSSTLAVYKRLMRKA